MRDFPKPVAKYYSRIMQFDFYLGRARRDDDVPDIIRVHNCSEVDGAGLFYKQDGKYYCCDLQSEDAPECQTDSALRAS